MKEAIKNAVEEYQCPGCVCGSDIECYEDGESVACGKHVIGATVSGIGRIALGMPTGFNRIGDAKEMKINIFEEFDSGWVYDKYNVPVWKHLDKHGNTLVRGISPRINYPFLHVFIGDCRDRIECFEITNDDLAEMD